MAAEGERAHRRILRRVRIGFGIVVLALVVAGWATDVISRQGERTIYTVECTAGDWVNGHCTGRLVAAERINFQASRANGEVVFWSVGARSSRERLAPCSVQDGRNWVCADDADAHKSITLALSGGRILADPQGRTRPCHVVSKWRWWLLRAGV